jgi:penicillin-binding protein 2
MSSKVSSGMSRVACNQKQRRLALVVLCLLVSVVFLTVSAANGQSRRQRRNSQARREAAHRRAAIARQRAIDGAMRKEVQWLISKDNTAGEDAEVRRAVISALGNHSGTVVVMDPKTGRVYSIVNQEWALRRGFKPCSTIKLVTGLAGLNEKVIDPPGTVVVTDAYHMDLTDALAHSNNTYFQQVGGRVGFDKMISYARQLGLGEKTGINLANEFPGQVPQAKSGFAVNHMSSHGDDFKVTALQLATLVSAMTNGGKLLAPHVSPGAQKETKFKPEVRRLVQLDPNTWARMIPGMVGAVNYGSGRRAYDPAETVAGKTGTCIEEGTWVGLFASYAPLVNPRLAVVVIARGSDAHGHFPAAVAGQIYRDLNGRFCTPTNLQIATTRDLSGTGLNEEDQDETGAEALEFGQASLTSTMRAPRSSSVVTKTYVPTLVNMDLPIKSSVKLVLMPIPKRTPRSVQKPSIEMVPQTKQRPHRVTDGPQ